MFWSEGNMNGHAAHIADVAVDDADGYADADAEQVWGQLGGVWSEQGCGQLLHDRTGEKVSCYTEATISQLYLCLNEPKIQDVF